MDGAPPKKKKKLIKKNAADEAPSADSDGDEGGGGGKKTIIIAIAIGFLMMGVGIGVGMFAGGMLMGEEPKAASGDGAAAEEAAAAEAEDEINMETAHTIYVSVGKILATVEHKGATRYIQAEMDLVGYDKNVMDSAQHEMPAIRNRLLMLFSSQDFDTVKTVEGREQLRLQSVDAVNEVLGIDPEKKRRVSDAYFTAFVTQ